jgi:predicted DCC family thiol-disulfide oxidoreductase YuxK
LAPARPIFLYDADCGLCSTLKWMASFADQSHNLAFLPLTEAANLGLLDSLPRSQWFASSHMLRTDGSMSSAGDALFDLISSLPGFRAFGMFGTAPPLKRTTARLYGALSHLHADSCIASYSGEGSASSDFAVGRSSR